MSRSNRELAQLIAANGFSNAYVKRGAYGASFEVVATKDTTAASEVVAQFGSADEADAMAVAINRNAKRCQPFRNFIKDNVPSIQITSFCSDR